MDNFQVTFIAEAKELILGLEKILLDFELDLQNDHSVREIFHVMHTLKGAGKMFGFENISLLTHDLETIYDGIRDNKIQATKRILEVTLEAVDHLKELLQDPHLHQESNKQNHQRIDQLVKECLHETELFTGTVKERKQTTYYVLIEPQPLLLKNGTNLLFLVDDVAALGEALVMPSFNDLPTLNQFQSDTCYTRFEVILVTERPPSEINDVFIFAEDHCKVTVAQLSSSNLLSATSFVSQLKEKALQYNLLGFEQIHSFAEKHDADSVKREQKKNQSGDRNKESSIRVSSYKLDELMNLISELVISQARLSLIASQHGIGELVAVAETMDKITRRLRENTFNICLIPIETLVTRFQRLVRDLSIDLHKEIEFIAIGSDTELDRSIIEKITDPILHILRNSIDHGIEFPDERIKQGKSRQGQIVLKAYHAGTSVFIQIRDDGRGIDTGGIKAKALHKGLIAESDDLSEKELLNLIFAPGFSMAEKVSDISGRGVGMDIVKRNIESIQGEVSLESREGEGTSITIKLPLTLSIMDGLLVNIASSSYILPLASVNKCFEIQTERIKPDIVQKIVLDGKLIPLLNLREAFLEGTWQQPYTQIILLHYDDFPVAITVDTIVGQYQAVMKPLGEIYRGQHEFNGATILGDGSVALVIDPDKLIKQLIEKNKT
ncbi:chemotaxis protein CheA [Ohtaekwangia sp.]|uniref:chemotaxis protein CheA n=1 Tax=Ohtaekwangia sp. TaxID=2066019 RepID=UPI002FDC7AB8